MPHHIAFDLSHKPRGKIDENYTELRDHLNKNGFMCYNFLETPITQDSLKPYDILVFVCPDFSKISSQEITEITNWVKNDGGGLLLLNHAGGDRGRNSNLGELSEQFGLGFENDQVLDEINNLGLENMPVITAANFIPPHPITNGINELCYRSGCSLMVIGSAISIVSSNETSVPFSCSLICVSEIENGRVCGIGSYEMFRDKIGGGIQQEEHVNLALNIFNWLVSDYRAELTKHGVEHPFSATLSQPVSSQTQISEKYTSPDSTDVSDYQKMQGTKSIEKIEASLKFSSKEELIILLNSYLTHMKTIETNIQNIIKQINLFGNTLFEHHTPPTQIPETKESEKAFSYNEQEQTEQTDNSQRLEVNQRNYNKTEQKKAFSVLPAKPVDFIKMVEKEKSKKEFIGLEPVKSRQTDTIEKVTDKALSEIKKPVKPKATAPIVEPREGKEGLQDELISLESKLNSVFNLISFIEKKREAKKLDDKSYKNQMNKLQKDLEQTKSRIEGIKRSLGI